MSTNRREFIRNVAVDAAGITIGGAAPGFSAKSYSRIVGANDRLNIALMGCGRRVGAYYAALQDKKNNVDVAYICDVMKKQREKVGKDLNGKISGKATLVNDIHEVWNDQSVDAIFNATPDHWHAPGTWMAMQAGKHVYIEKPCSHNPREGELLVAFQKKYGKVVQMGNQQRSAKESQEIISEIHKGAIGDVYKAVAFYANMRGECPVPKKAPVPDGLDWELFQGPAPHQEYMHDIWDYNWHWYGWNWGTAETGNNATHELDIARWALQVKYPEHVDVEAAKGNYPVIVTPTEFCYFNYYQAFPPKEPLAIGGYLTLDKVYSFEPIPSFCSKQQAKQIMGTQANLWTEYISTPEYAEYMLFPRLAALAEVAWTNKERKDYTDFSKRLYSLLIIYINRVINYRDKQLPYEN